MRGTRAQAIAALGLLTSGACNWWSGRSAAPYSARLRLTSYIWLLLLIGGDPPGVADVATLPPGEGPVGDDLGGADGVSIALMSFTLLSASPWLHEAHQLNCHTTYESRGFVLDAPLRRAD